MVDLKLHPPMLRIDVQGWHQLWAFKQRIEVPLAQVRSIRRAPGAARGFWKGWRLPGTHVPGLIVAGSYYQNGQWTFYDVVNSQNAVGVELDRARSGADYDRLVVEVASPEQAIRRVREALPST